MLSSNLDTTTKALTREEVVIGLANRINAWLYNNFDIDWEQDEEFARELLDWLDSIGYYNMHFYGVATTKPTEHEH